MENSFEKFALRIMAERVQMMEDLEFQRKKVKMLEQVIHKTPLPILEPELDTTYPPLTLKRRGRPIGSKNKPKTVVCKGEV
jgi:hypothetical protein